MTLSPQQVENCRQQFPALSRRVGGRPAVYFDGPAGSQVPQRVIDAVAQCLAHTNANHGGLFATSRESDAMLAEAHAALADLVGGDDPDCIAFGANMTTLTLALSRSLAATWRPGDEIVLTELDHDANIAPWRLAAQDRGVTVRLARINAEDATLDLADLRDKINPRTRLVAVGCASNSTGGVNGVAEICGWAHEAGALAFLDAVHYAPHVAIDVQQFGCDFLACSAYKFFGPHVGVLWGRRELLEELPAYKVRPAPDTIPGKWMTGTQNHEGIAGAAAAVEYLADLGRAVAHDTVSNDAVSNDAVSNDAVSNDAVSNDAVSNDAASNDAASASTCAESQGGATGAAPLPRRRALEHAFAAIGGYERELGRRFLTAIADMPAYKVWGIADADDPRRRLPTFSITHHRLTPADLAEALGRCGIFTWHGHYYALALSEALAREPEGMLRVGLLHYNTAEEVDRLIAALAELDGG